MRKLEIGIPTEIKNHENRVGLTPEGVRSLTSAGHKVFVQAGAGLGSGYTDEDYKKARATIVANATQAWNHEMIIKVKEPLTTEYGYFKKDMVLFTYLHLADNLPLTKALLKSKVCGIAYETMLDANSKIRLPLLAPMSRVAGRRAAIIGATHLESHHGGQGLLPGGVDNNSESKGGTDKGLYLVIGGGVAGYNAAVTAAGLGANVTILEANPKRILELKKDEKLGCLSELHKTKITVDKAGSANVSKWITKADVLISTVLIPGAKAPNVVTTDQVKTMKKGSVIIDISIDQGGSVQTIDHITTHDKPTYNKFGVSHYAVANMPGATARTSTEALSTETIPFAIKIATLGAGKAIQSNKIICSGVNTYDGYLTNEPVAQALNLRYHSVLDLIKHKK